MTLRLLRAPHLLLRPLLPRIPSLSRRIRRRSTIKVRGILGNPRIPPPWPLESTWPRSVGVDRGGRTRKTLVEPYVSTATRRDTFQTSVWNRHKLVSVSATSTSTIGAREEALERVTCIHYPVQFRDTDKALIQALIDSGSEVNIMHPSFAKQLGLPIRPTDVGTQKIDDTALNTHEMVVIVFSVVDKAN